MGRSLANDLTSFFALSWKAPQQITEAYRDHLSRTYQKELELLLVALPARFELVIRNTLDSLPEIILSLPTVLLHKDLGDFNISVGEPSCHLVGVIDWAEAEVALFGTNLHSLLNIS